MNKLVAVCLVAGCWTSSKPASESPTPAPVTARSTGADAYGGAAYGGAGYAGALDSIAPQQQGAFGSLTGDITYGLDDTNIYGGVLGDDVEADGGLGMTGAGSKGGGTDWGTIGTGRYGAIGPGSGTGSGYGRARPPRASVPRVRIGQPTVTGDLDKAIIRRFVKRNAQKLQYCYERELLATPGIEGTLTARFTITLGTGLVASSTAKGVHANVEACVARVIKAIEFPRPKGDKDVQVVYPFTYAAIH